MRAGDAPAAWRAVGAHLEREARSLGGVMTARSRALLLKAAQAYAQGGSRADVARMLAAAGRAELLPSSR